MRGPLKARFSKKTLALHAETHIWDSRPDQTRTRYLWGGVRPDSPGRGGVFQVKKEPGSTMGQSALFKNRTGRFSSQDYA